VFHGRDHVNDDLEGSRAAHLGGSAELLTAAARTAAAGGPVGAAAPARPWVARLRARDTAVLAAFVAAGAAVTWPRAAYLTGRLPRTRDASSYVWALWWVARQVTHLGNPWFTSYMAAPAGIRLGFDTTMPLLGVLMAPITLTLGPAASFTVLTIAVPGLASYAMYRAARLWLGAVGAVAAGAFFGLSSMLTWQDWYHLNIAAGSVLLPLTLETAVRLHRAPSVCRGVVVGLVLGASVLVNQESAVLAAILAAAVLVPSLLAAGAAARLKALAAGVATGVLIASPQLIAMGQQALAGGNTVPANMLASTYGAFVASLTGLFAPSPRIAGYGLARLGSIYRSPAPGDSLSTFGVVLSVLAVAGLATSWRRRRAWLFALLWLGCGALALGPALHVGGREYIPLAQTWHGLRESLVMPYTWFVRVPLLSAFREADRLLVAGLVGAALLAGQAVDWLRRHAWPALIAVALLGALEAGWAGRPGPAAMPAAMVRLDAPIAADHTGSIVVDVPFGLRGGIPLYGDAIDPAALVIATADGHPRAISYTSWVPAPTTAAIRRHAFYAQLITAQEGRRANAAQTAAAREDLRSLHVGWVLIWEHPSGPLVDYLSATGFRFSYRAGGVFAYRHARQRCQFTPGGSGPRERGPGPGRTAATCYLRAGGHVRT
jgi:hypothetical protein